MLGIGKKLALLLYMFLKFQRRVLEQKQRMRRATPSVVLASDVSLESPFVRPSSHSKNNLERHAYDGPMQFTMSPNNPDQIMTKVTVNTYEGRFCNHFA